MALDELSHEYKVTSSGGDHDLAWSVNVVGDTGCVMVLFVEGHNFNLETSEYLVFYSQDTCDSGYSNDKISEGKNTIVVLSESLENTTYKITITNEKLSFFVCGTL